MVTSELIIFGFFSNYVSQRKEHERFARFSLRWTKIVGNSPKVYFRNSVNYKSQFWNVYLHPIMAHKKHTKRANHVKMIKRIQIRGSHEIRSSSTSIYKLLECFLKFWNFYTHNSTQNTPRWLILIAFSKFEKVLKFGNRRSSTSIFKLLESFLKFNFDILSTIKDTSKIFMHIIVYKIYRDG